MCRVTLLAFLCVGAAAAAAQDTAGTRPTVTADPVPETSTAEPDQAGPATITTETEPTSPRTTTARWVAEPSPPLISKLSYFNRANTGSSGGLSTNSVGRPDGDGKRRRFKSRCRCEKIWNCPKLQITVPRCPDEYFLCCF